ncbi:MAG: hypothetical protein HGJ94_16020 [Desulfosarcina sp.]|nr:hypothetical protein [Desulfosarcina sp.]MBC2745190.1 hypothetical protein [Desulfosarcina sp.]MBC2768098.1 hypothetical protein [Desulfosarcina sp.]
MKSIKIETVGRVSERNGELHAVGKCANGAQGHIALTDVRGAVSPPAADTPGYWIIFGVKYGCNDKGKPVNMFMREGESKNHRRLIDDLSEAAGKYRAREIYCPESCGLYSTLVKKFWQVKGTFVRPAPHESDIDFGVSLVISALEDETLDIPRGTILHGQLEQMTADNMGYTIHPLRYLLSAFQMYTPRRAGSSQVVKRSWYWG